MKLNCFPSRALYVVCSALMCAGSTKGYFLNLIVRKLIRIRCLKSQTRRSESGNYCGYTCYSVCVELNVCTYRLYITPFKKTQQTNTLSTNAEDFGLTFDSDFSKCVSQ